MFDFQQLSVYQKAKAFHQQCGELINTVALVNYRKDQFNRASFSIILNIAEGSAKFSKADRKNYFTNARGSVFECVAILDVLHDENRISNESFHLLLNAADELSRMLFAMIKNLA